MYFNDIPLYRWTDIQDYHAKYGQSLEIDDLKHTARLILMGVRRHE